MLKVDVPISCFLRGFDLHQVSVHLVVIWRNGNSFRHDFKLVGRLLRLLPVEACVDPLSEGQQRFVALNQFIKLACRLLQFIVGAAVLRLLAVLQLMLKAKPTRRVSICSLSVLYVLRSDLCRAVLTQHPL